MTTPLEVKKPVITPGGRQGNDRSIGSSSNGENWVEREGGMPRYMRIVRNGLMRDGMPKGRATALAVGAIKRWARGGGDVSPKVRAAAQAALAQWEKMKASANSKGIETDFMEVFVLDVKSEHDLIFYANRSTPQVVKRGEQGKPKAGYGKVTKRRRATEEEESTIAKGDWVQVDESGNKPTSDKYKKTKYRPALVKMDVSDLELKSEFPATLLQELHDHIDTTTETKDADMEMEYKTVGVTGLKVDDAALGIVTTLVSVTGIVDNVKDVIHPGAYEKSLKGRTPKGVWSHSWDTPVSKTLDVKELQPGDPDLPKTLPNGAPWPRGAGALKVKTQFNLETQRGREAYSDVTFFGDQQEWSIGYQVPVGGARIDSKTGQRHIDYLELYEYSPVLFGAMSAARTVGPGVKSLLEFESVKDAQSAYRAVTMSEVDFKAWADELNVEFKGFDPTAIEVKGMGGLCDCDDPNCTAKHKTRQEKSAEEEGAESKTNKSGHSLRTRASAARRAKEVEAEDEELDLFDDAEGKTLFQPTAFEYDVLVKTRDALDLAIKSADAAFAESGTEEETKGLSDIIEKNADALGEFAEEMKDAAEAFDTAYDLDDVGGMNEFGNDFLELVEKALEHADSEDDAAMASILHKTAAAVASMAPADEDDTDTPEDDEDEDDTETPEGKPRPLPKKPEKKADEQSVTEFKSLDTSQLNDLRVAFDPRRRR